MSNINDEQLREDLQVFLAKNDVGLEDVKYEIDEQQYFHHFQGNVEVRIDPDDTAIEFVQELQYIPKKWNDYFPLLKREFEKVDVGGDLTYADYEVTYLEN